MIFDDPGKGGSVRKFSKNVDFFFEIFENFGTDLGWFGGDIGTVWEYFRSNSEQLRN